MCIYLGSSNPPSVLFDLSKEMKSPQIHRLFSQRRWRALKSTILLHPRSCRARKSTTCPLKTIQSAWVYVPSYPPHVHLSWVYVPSFKVLGSMYLHTHHMSIYLGSSNLPSLLFYLSKEMESPQIHHLISQRRWRALKSTILIPPRSCKVLKSTTCPFKTIQSAWVCVPSTHDLSILISQRRWRTLKSTVLIPPRSCRSLISTTYPFKTIQSAWFYVPSNPPHVYLSWVFKPAICPFWSLKEDKVPSNPQSVHFDLPKEMKSPQIHRFDTSKEL